MDYKITETLSQEGRFGKVYKVQMLESGETFAMKRIEIYEDELELLKIAEKDYNKLLAIQNHRNIVELKGYNMNQDCYEIFTEYFPDGDLSTFLKDEGYRQPKEGLFLFYQILKGFQGLRDVGIVCKGLQSKNVMCFYKGCKLRIKIGDFGYNKPFGKIRAKKTRNCDLNLCTAPETIDPESFSEEERDLNKEDVWSAGCIFYEIMFNSHPFDASNKTGLLEKIKSGQYDFWTHPEIQVPDMFITWMRKCLKFKPSSRPTIAQMIATVK
jgi:serine/threonine protein kinase